MYRIQGGDQKEYGPITADQVRQWIADKRLNRFSLCAGTDGIWKPLGQFLEFNDALSLSGGASSDVGSGTSTGGTPSRGEVNSGRANALQQVSAPAMVLLIVGIVLALLSLANVVVLGSGKFVPPVVPGMDENGRRFMEAYFGFLSRHGWKVGVFQLFGASMAIVAAIRLKNLRSFGLVTTGTLLIMLPCFTPCCCLGLPVGIWVVMIMNRPEVKPYFE